MHPVIFLNHFCTHSSASFFKLYLNCHLWNLTLWCFFKWKVAVGEVTFQSISRHPLLQCEWMIWKKECWKLCSGLEQEGLEWGATWEHPTLIKRHATKEKMKTEKGKQEVPMTQSSPFTDLFWKPLFKPLVNGIGSKETELSERSWSQLRLKRKVTCVLLNEKRPGRGHGGAPRTLCPKDNGKS